MAQYWDGGTDFGNIASPGSVYFGHYAVAVVMGWWHPVTLTAGSCYYANNGDGATISMASGDTSEININVYCSTTNGDWTTSGAGIVADEWIHISHFFELNNTGPAADHRIWIGRMGQAPQLVTLNQNTAPAGTFQGNIASTLGNNPAQSAGFDGYIEAFEQIKYYATLPSELNGVGTAEAGTIDAIQEQHVYNTIVHPHWSGNLTMLRRYLPSMAGVAGSATCHLQGLRGTSSGTQSAYRQASASSECTRPVTISGPEDTLHRPPSRYDGYHLLQPTLIPSRRR